MANGKIKFFNPSKGFGFIAGSEGDVFFHASALPSGMKSIEEGQSVSFDVKPGERGPRAVDIKIAR